MALSKNKPISPQRLRDEISREEAKQFAREYEAWKQTVPREETGWEFYAAALGLIRLDRILVGGSGFKRCSDYTVMKPWDFMRLSKLYSGMQDYYTKVEYSKRKEVEALAASAPERSGFSPGTALAP